MLLEIHVAAKEAIPELAEGPLEDETCEPIGARETALATTRGPYSKSLAFR